MEPVVAAGRVLKNISEGAGCFRLWIDAPAVAHSARPGQFVNIRASDTAIPLLRRPFSYCDIQPGAFSVLFQVVGPGTRRMSQLSEGAEISIVGPLGNGFDTRAPTTASILCAGGIGVAPFPALARDLVSKSAVQVIIGARTAALCLCKEDFRALGVPVSVATEDGSEGYKGYVTGPLRDALEACKARDVTVYGCGPQPMLAAVSRMCEEYGCPAQLSVEAVMGCGVGACLSCVFPTPDGRCIRSCVEGPIFRTGEILF